MIFDYIATLVIRISNLFMALIMEGLEPFVYPLLEREKQVDWQEVKPIAIPKPQELPQPIEKPAKEPVVVRV